MVIAFPNYKCDISVLLVFWEHTRGEGTLKILASAGANSLGRDVRIMLSISSGPNGLVIFTLAGTEAIEKIWPTKCKTNKIHYMRLQLQ